MSSVKSNDGLGVGLSSRRTNLLVAGLLFGLGLAMAYDSLQMSLYTSIGPGPGFFPLWIALGIMGTATHWIWGALRPPYRDADGQSFPDSAGRYRIAIAAGASIGFAVLLDPIGFVPACFLYLLALLKLISRSSLPWAIAMAAITSLAVLLLFSFLGIRLPPSFLNQAL